MNWLDLILGILLIGGVVSGFKNGIIGEIASLMSKHKAHLIPVIENDMMIGVVARLDLIKAVEV